MAIAIGGRFRGALLAAGIAGLSATPSLAGPLDFLPGVGGGNEPAQVVPVQVDDAQFRISQLEEQIRNLTGRVEELSFQIIQMQEQMRQAQEDNEFRFQSLEGGVSASDRSSLETPPASGGQGAAPTDSAAATLPGIEPNVTASTPPPAEGAQGATAAPTPPTLGAITFDEQGNLSGTLSSGASGSNANGQTAALSVDDPNALYRDAYNLVLSGDYAEAEAAFQDYIDIYPDGGQVADANFWLGESQYSQGSFNDAARTFLNAHQSYPQAEKAPDMLLKLGMSLAALDNRDTACATYREVLSRYPDTSQAIKDKVAAEQRDASC